MLRRGRGCGRRQVATRRRRDDAAAGAPSCTGEHRGRGGPALVVRVRIDVGKRDQLGNGDGTFRSERNFAAGPRPQAVTVGDFNGDGRQDLAVTNLVSLPDTTTGSVAILLGNGNGAFQSAQQFEARRFPESVAVGDFNGDERLDLAVANFGSVGPEAAIVSILLGNGDGTLQPAQDFGPIRRATSVAVGDFNGDGLFDLAVTHGGSAGPEDAIVSILLGYGDGTFQPARDFGTGSGPQVVVVGDFNGDGQLDLAVANTFANTVSILLGHGDGTFQPRQDFGVGSNPAAVAVGDFNGDGRLDLAVANGLFTPASTLVSILLGNGDGTFQPAQSFGAGSRASSVGGGDFNGDGRLDLAVGNIGSITVSVLLGNGDGTFQPVQNFGASGVSSVVVGDFNGDGRLDLASAFVSILMNDTPPPTSCLGTGSSRLRGRVRMVADRSGIPDVTMTLTGPEGCQDTTTTNAQGHYRFRALGNGTYTVTPTKAGCTFTPTDRTVTIAEADPLARFRGTCGDPKPARAAASLFADN